MERPSPGVIAALGVATLTVGLTVGVIAGRTTDGARTASRSTTSTTAEDLTGTGTGPAGPGTTTAGGSSPSTGGGTTASTGVDAVPPASLGALLIPDPAGFVRQPDEDLGGPRSLAVAADDDGGDDALGALKAAGFVGGWQRTWTVPGQPDQELFIDLKQFTTPAGASRWSQRIDALLTDPSVGQGASRLPDPSTPPGARAASIVTKGYPTEVDVVAPAGTFVVFVSVRVVDGDPVPTPAAVQRATEQVARLPK